MEKFKWSSIEKEHVLETYKSLVGYASDGLKLLSLLNGGAIVALLAFIGNTYGKNGGTYPDMRVPVGLFISGLLFCCLAYFACYTTQLRLFKEITGQSGESHQKSFRTAAAFMSLSLVAFGTGAFVAAILFGRS